MRRSLFATILVIWPIAGCSWDESDTSLVSSDPFKSASGVLERSQASFRPSSLEAAARVDTLGRKIVNANPQLGIQPLFRTIGAPQPEVFHQGTTEVDITEGLVIQCKSEAELAAVLCNELGRMVAEREAIAGPKLRVPEREPPQDVRIGSDSAGSFGTADQTHLAELAKFDRRRDRSSTPLAPPDPQFLARSYLVKAGYAEKDLDSVTPLLQAAANNTTFERQFSPASPPRPWIH
jgi:hypothetical protein